MAEAVTNRPTFLMYDGVGSSKAALALPREQYRDEMLGGLYAITDELVTLRMAAATKACVSATGAAGCSMALGGMSVAVGIDAWPPRSYRDGSCRT